MEWWNSKSKKKKTKLKLGDTQFIKLKTSLYLTSHTKPQRLRRYAASKKRLSRMDKVSINPFLLLGKPKKISKRNLSWPQAKRRFPLLRPRGDADKDKVMNLLDCRPFNRKRQDTDLDRRLEEIRKGKHGTIEEQMAYKKKMRKIHTEQDKLAREMGYPRGIKQVQEEDFDVEDEDDVTLDLPEEDEKEESNNLKGGEE